MSYAKIGPTAWYVASQRALSDIKYAREIFDEICHYADSATPEEGAYLKSAKMDNGLAPMFEARYKLTDKIINQSGIKQVLEIAAGLTPRGLAYTDNPDFVFIETDLPEMISEKRKLIRKIAGERNNLHLEEADALDRISLMGAVDHLQASPVVVVTEGLLRYLNFEQKAAVAGNIHAILDKFGGFWVTPDIAVSSQSRYGGTASTGHQAGVLKLSGINLEKNRFPDTENGQKFMEDLGFTVERIPSMDVLDELVSPRKVDMDVEDVRKSLKGRETFVMKIR